MKNPAMLTVVVLCLGLLAGCGYTTSSALPPHLKSIHIEPFENRVDYAAEGSRKLYIPLLEVKVRNALIDRFLFDGNLRPTEAPRADLVLSGVLKGYDRSVLRYTDDDDVEEYRVHIVMSLSMYDTHKQEVIWTEPSFVGEATFFLSGPLASSEDVAVDEAIEDLARRIVERTIEDW